MRRSSTAPRWDGVFAFHWNKDKDQRFRFRMYDDIKLSKDKFKQEAWVSVSDYVAKDQNYSLPLTDLRATLHIVKKD
ncbi:hypothetical protein Ocin01_16960 [Orchesella cincta]|uniref:C2 domain-containing protein n=1 Tax=Orchesella cincta TaxID=48709 RepID=A0A1D2M9W5_ORCCI|nr:hypothetical protein Ocin01_16960 [Orchesella cincta]